MKEFHITRNDSGQRLNKFLEKSVPRLPGGLMHKYIRLKRIKVNGKRTDPAYLVKEGDTVQVETQAGMIEYKVLEIQRSN